MSVFGSGTICRFRRMCLKAVELDFCFGVERGGVEDGR
jgi:hypothetical protein